MLAGLIAPGTYISNLSGGRKLVTTAGTRVQLSTSSVPCQGLIIQSLRSNSGNISIGGEDVSGTLGTENGVELSPGQTMTLFCKDVSLVWMDSDINSEGIQYLILHG
jgi:hypothetical protein